MIIALWIVNAFLALIFLAVGLMKLARPRTALAASGMAWTADSTDAAVKGIGAIEILGAIGLIVPLATGIAPVLTPLAAAGLAVVMIGAVIVHIRRKESAVVPLILGILAIVSTVLGFLTL